MIQRLIHPFILARSGPKPGGAILRALSSSDSMQLPEQLAATIIDGEHALTARGFAPPFRSTNHISGEITSCVSLLEHPDEVALGFIMVAVPRVEDPVAITTFMSEFADGWKMFTSNAPTILRTPPRQNIDGARFLNVRDAGDLYDIHRGRVKLRAGTSRVIPVTRGVDPIAYQDREARESQAFWIEKGYYRRIEGDRIELTALGATLAAWRGLFPWKYVTEWRHDRRTQAVLEQLALAMRPQSSPSIPRESRP